MNETLCIETTKLTKIYGSGNTEVVAMRDASMSVRKGEVVALLGPELPADIEINWSFL